MSDPKPPKPDIVFSDPHHAPVLYTDWVINCGMTNGLGNINLGVVDHSLRKEEADPVAVTVVAKLRLTRSMAENLHVALTKMLAGDFVARTPVADEAKKVRAN